MKPDVLFIAADYAPEGDLRLDAWFKSADELVRTVNDLPDEDYERLKAAVDARNERRHSSGARCH